MNEDTYEGGGCPYVVVRRPPSPVRPLGGLLPESQSIDEGLVPLWVLPFQILEKAPPLADELQEAVAGMVVLLVRFEVLLELADPAREERNLNLGRPCVRSVDLIRIDDFFLVYCCHGSFCSGLPEEPLVLGFPVFGDDPRSLCLFMLQRRQKVPPHPPAVNFARRATCSTALDREY
jgi:hypothetical protein